MKIIDFETADSNLTKVTVITEPRVSEKVFQATLRLMKNLNFPPPALHQGRLVFPNASCLANQATMNTLKSVLEKAAKEVNNARFQEEKRRTQYLNQFRQAAGLAAKDVVMPSSKGPGQGQALTPGQRPATQAPAASVQKSDGVADAEDAVTPADEGEE
jgi:hypothetical protein